MLIMTLMTTRRLTECFLPLQQKSGMAFFKDFADAAPAAVSVILVVAAASFVQQLLVMHLSPLMPFADAIC